MFSVPVRNRVVGKTFVTFIIKPTMSICAQNQCLEEVPANQILLLATVLYTCLEKKPRTAQLNKSHDAKA